MSADNATAGESEGTDQMAPVEDEGADWTAADETGGTEWPAAEGGFAPRPDGDATELERRCWAAIDGVPDPHIPVSLVEMGMIYDVRAEDGTVTVEMTYPCMGCPAYDMLQNDVESCLRVLDGVESVAVEVVWEPVWSKDMLSPRVREKIREAGIGL